MHTLRLTTSVSALVALSLLAPACDDTGGGGVTSEGGGDTTGVPDPDDPGTDTDDPGTDSDEPETDSDEPGTDTDEPVDTEGGGEPAHECLGRSGALDAGWSPGEGGAPESNATPEELDAASATTWNTGLRMLRVTEPDETIGLSPLTLATSASMAYLRHGRVCDGALEDLTGAGLTGESVPNAYASLSMALAERNLEADESQEIDAVEFSLVPSTWSFSGSGSDVSLAPFGAAQHVFEGEDLAAMNTVMNCVIEQQSRGLLVDFLPPSIPAQDTASLDLVVAYLGAPWRTALETRGDLSFTKADGTEVMVEAVGAEIVDARVVDDADKVAVALPLRGDALEVLFVMPKAPGGLQAFVDETTVETLASLRQALDPALIELDMPIVDTQPQTVDYVEALDLECQPFTVRQLLGGAAVRIDDNGVTAAGAGAAEGWVTAGPPEPDLEVALDRPYVFFVYDRDSNALLFDGRFAG